MSITRRDFLGLGATAAAAIPLAPLLIPKFELVPDPVVEPVKADDLVVEGSGNSGISILTPNSSHCSISFGTPADKECVMRYTYTSDLLIAA